MSSQQGTSGSSHFDADRPIERREQDRLGETEAEGRRYLEKIVQVSYDLPTVREAILPDMFLQSLEELMEGCNLAEPDRDMWRRVFYDVVKPLLGNLRDVKRYSYSNPVTLDTIGQEVSLADLLGLEALRVLRPPLFNELRAHVNCLVRSESVPESWLNEEVRNGACRRLANFGTPSDGNCSCE